MLPHVHVPRFNRCRYGVALVAALAVLGASPLAAQGQMQPSDHSPTRPQTPVPPFPYSEREVAFAHPVEGFTLAGTLSIPPASPVAHPEKTADLQTRHPAVILITGSGAQDRDETLFAHKPFAVIKDHLARRGVAVLRLDDRGVGGSGGDMAHSTTLDFATDIYAAVDFLRQQPEIDPACIGLLGHSEGGVIAPIVAAQRDDIAFVVLLAGTGVNGAEILRLQMVDAMKGMIPDASIERLKREGYDLIKRCGDSALSEADRLEAVKRLVTIQVGLDPDATERPPADQRRIDAGVKQGQSQLASPWMRLFLRLEPSESLAKVRCPVLILNGSKDVQVNAAQNVPVMVKILSDAGNPDVTARIIPGVNHLFQPCKSGGVLEYGFIETTIDPRVLDEVGDWIGQRAGPRE